MTAEKKKERREKPRSRTQKRLPLRELDEQLRR
jgi:hypothetical protein